jgi:phage terminase large subunit GpA-like protein
VTRIPGPWDTDVFPHQRGIARIWELKILRRLILMWGSQLGKTVLTPALNGWTARNRPAPSFVGAPDATSLKRFYQTKLYPMLESSRETRGMLLPEKQRRFPTVDLEEMLIHGGWSGSVTQLGDVSARDLYFLELDKWSGEETGEGDSEKLAEDRCKAWENYRILKESTPTLAGASRIERAMLQADVVLWYKVPCPKCGEYQILRMGEKGWDKPGLAWDPDRETGHSTPQSARSSANYVCEKCLGVIRDQHRRKMFLAGVWAPEDVEVTEDDREGLVAWDDRGPVPNVATRISSLYSPMLSWGRIAEAFINAKDGGPRALQGFVNGWEGRTFKVKENLADWELLKRTHATEVPRGVVPAWADILVGGIDVHKYKNHWGVMAWGPGPRAAVIEEGIVAEPIHDERGRIDDALESILGHEWEKENGGGLTVRLALVDSGYNTGSVYRSCDKWGARAQPIREATRRTGAPAPFQWSTREKDRVIGGARRKRKPVPRGKNKLGLVDGDYWSAELSAMLERDPEEPGALLFFENPPDAFMRAVCNVYPAIQRDNRGMDRIVWKVDDEEFKDHQWDMLCYCLVAAQLLRVRFRKADAPPRRKRNPPPVGSAPATGGSNFRQMNPR